MPTQGSPNGLAGFVQSIPPARLAGLGLVLAVVAYRHYQDVRWRLHRSLSWWAPSPSRRR
jgi:hypothetical protein